jgi:tetratricopeptide (TPR) repeat protein
MRRTIIFTSFLQLSRNFILGILLMNSFILNAQGVSKESFEAGNAAYNEGDFTKAISFYEQTLEMGQHSAALYFNLGNAYYRLNKVAESIYYFEKAKQLDPDNNDIKVNSAFAKNMTIDAIEAIPESQLARIQKGIFGLFSITAWSVFALIWVWLFALFFIAYLFVKATDSKRIFFFLSLLFLVLFVGSLSISFTLDQQQKETQYAILFSNNIDIWSEPNQRGEIQFTLHEGTKIQLLEALDEWNKIRIANGSEGWIKNAEFKSLNN